MCGASLHLLFAVLLVMNVVVENEAMTTNISQTTTAISVSLPHDANKSNDTLLDQLEENLQNFTDGLPSTTVENTTTPKSDSPTPPFVTEHLQTSNATTQDLNVMVTQTITTKKTQITKITKKSPPNEPEPTTSYGSTYIIILIIVLLCIIGVTIYCCLQKNTRRYSMDLHPKQEDAQIPLSTVDAEVFDGTSPKDMQTFSPVESNVPLKDPEPEKEAEKPDGEKKTVDVKQEQSNTQPIVTAEDKVEELTIVDLTNGEMANSTKTSIEPLDEPLNKNNSNNNTRVQDL